MCDGLAHREVGGKFALLAVEADVGVTRRRRFEDPETFVVAELRRHRRQELSAGGIDFSGAQRQYQRVVVPVDAVDDAPEHRCAEARGPVWIAVDNIVLALLPFGELERAQTHHAAGVVAQRHRLGDLLPAVFGHGCDPEHHDVGETDLRCLELVFDGHVVDLAHRRDITEARVLKQFVFDEVFAREHHVVSRKRHAIVPLEIGRDVQNERLRVVLDLDLPDEVGLDVAARIHVAVTWHDRFLQYRTVDVVARPEVQGLEVAEQADAEHRALGGRFLLGQRGRTGCEGRDRQPHLHESPSCRH